MRLAARCFFRGASNCLRCLPVSKALSLSLYYFTTPPEPCRLSRLGRRIRHDGCRNKDRTDTRLDRKAGLKVVEPRRFDDRLEPARPLALIFS